MEVSLYRFINLEKEKKELENQLREERKERKELENQLREEREKKYQLQQTQLREYMLQENQNSIKIESLQQQINELKNGNR